MSNVVSQALMHQQMLSGGQLHLCAYEFTNISEFTKIFSCVNRVLQSEQSVISTTREDKLLHQVVA